ncbi:Ig-like domain-containing protein [Lewinella sp. W8]|uniref:Ig-like domain-containing protein n=1 Tax=Lewinella sp. W8 TaxID=2528208 RepID=UPI00106762B2|nr:Ig-like domain-containing protein [Lewinella sp. W8]MTB50009.1 hypothetical protein [Lewinella sp. W8]
MNKIINSFGRLLLVGLLVFTFSCERDLEELELATFPANGLVFDDTFSAGLREYSAFGGSKLTGFQVVDEVAFAGTSSMQFEVPDFEDPGGAFVGGAFIPDGARDLSGFNVLTFYARASEAEFIGEIGFGNDFGSNTYVASITNVPVTTNWKKYYIPIPDPSKLTAERGLFFLSEGPDEEGRGYTFWIDEVRFENLGTVVPVNSGIFNGEELTETVETGAVFTANGFVTYNLPTGVDQRSSASPAYFEFTSSNPSVASVDANGIVTVLDAGEAVITASIDGVESVGSLSITSTGDPILPAGPAPTPEVPADDVISLFSNAYQDEPVDFYNGFWEFSTTQSAIVQVQSDDIIRYSQLNFVGIQFTSPTIDISAMNRVHLDIWTPDPTPAGAEFKVLLVDLGADGNFGGNDDSSFEVTFTPPTLQSEQWVSLDLPLSDFPGLTGRTNLAQVVLSGNLPNIFMDNLYFYNDGGNTGGGDDEPTMAAPTPSRNAADVISLFSDAYDDVPVDTWRTEWSVAAFEDVNVDGNPTKKYSALDFVGIETVNSPVDASNMTHLHMDVWSGDFTFFAVKLVDFGADGAFGGGDDVEHQIDIPMPAQEQWISYDFLLDDFVNLTTRSNIAQYILVGQPSGASTVFVDNLYFYNDDGGGNPTEPTMAAPTPTEDEADVISLFSDAYTDVSVDTWRTDWSAATFEDVMVAGNATKKYSDLDFVGIETVMNTVDASEMTNFRMDVWSGDYTFFGFKLVDFGADGAFGGGDDVEHQINIEMPDQAQWVSFDFPLDDFTGLTTRSNIAQYIIVGQPTGATTIFVDNMYFYNGDGGGGGDLTEPDTPAPTPSFDAANVISIFSDAYTDVTVDTYRTDWSSADYMDFMVSGNATLQYSNLDFVGIETVASTVDASNMTHFSLDVWSADYTFFAIKLVDFGADGAFGGGDDVEHQVEFTMPAQQQWVTLDIPLSDFTNLTTTSNIAQYILVGQPTGGTTVFVDNMFFHN